MAAHGRPRRAFGARRDSSTDRRRGFLPVEPRFRKGRPRMMPYNDPDPGSEGRQGSP